MSDALSGVELGTYYVSVTTSERQLFAQLSTAGAASATAGGTASGSAFAKSFSGTATSQISSLLARYGPIALTGLVLQQGISQLLQVDTAEHQLTALGYTTQQTSEIMNDALSSVQNTAFGVADAATVASAAVSSGVAAGKPLTDYLSLIADTATVAKQPLQTIGTLFNRIQSQGILQAREINELQADGVPIFKALRDQYGLTGTALTNFVAKGGVDSADFLAIIKKNFGGAAVSAGDSIQGSFSKLDEEVATVGQNLLGGNAQAIPKFFDGLAGDLKPVADAASVIGVALGGVVTVASLVPGPLIAGAAALAIFSKFGPAITGGFQSAIGTMQGFSAGVTEGATAAEAAGSRMPLLVSGLTEVKSIAIGAGSALLDAFGGLPGLAVGAGIAALTYAFGQWSAATAAQTADVETLTDTLNANTGAVTATTRSSIFDSLKGDTYEGTDAITGIQELGLSTEQYTKIITEGGPAVDAYREKLEKLQTQYSNQAVLNISNADQPNQYDAATAALNGFNQETKDLSTSQQTAAQRVKAGLSAIAGEGDAAGAASKPVETFTQKVTSAFTAVSNLGKQNSAIQSLGSSLAKNGNTFNQETAAGIANSQALQTTLAALATSAGKNSTEYAVSVIGLMDQLKAQGINTSGILAAVDASLAKISGTKWEVYLDGSESVAAALKIAKANLLAAESAEALETNSKLAAVGPEAETIVKLQAEVAQLTTLSEQVNASQSSAGSQLAAGAASAAASAASAAASAENYKQDIVTAASALSDSTNEASEAASLVSAINDAYSHASITATARNKLLSEESTGNTQLAAIVAQQATVATNLAAANTALSNAQSAENDYQSQIAQGYQELGDLTKLAQGDAAAVEQYVQIGNTIYGSSSADSATSLITGLTNQVEAATEFQTAYQELTQEGLNAGSLQDLVTGFASSGDASVAEGLLNGGQSAIDQVNDLESQLNAIGTSMSTTSSNAFYSVGISAAQGVVSGLESQDSALTAAYKSLANNLLAEVKSTLGIHSPSTEMAYLAEMASQGWNNNLHFDSVKDAFTAAGSFEQATPGQPYYIQQTNNYAYSKTDAEAINDGLALAKAVFN